MGDGGGRCSVWPGGGGVVASRCDRCDGEVKAQRLKQSRVLVGSDRWCWSLTALFFCCCAFLVLFAVFCCSELRWRSEAALARRRLLLQDRVDVVHFAQPLEERDEIQQLGVGHVVEPRGHRNCVVGVEDVGGRRVVHDDHLVQVPTQTAQVLDVVPSVEDARLPEKTAAKSSPLIQQVRDRVCILG